MADRPVPKKTLPLGQPKEVEVDASHRAQDEQEAASRAAEWALQAARRTQQAMGKANLAVAALERAAPAARGLADEAMLFPEAELGAIHEVFGAMSGLDSAGAGVVPQEAVVQGFVSGASGQLSQVLAERFAKHPELADIHLDGDRASQIEEMTAGIRASEPEQESHGLSRY